MDTKLQKLVSNLQKLAKELGRTPNYAEATAMGAVPNYQIKKHGYNNLVKMAGLEPNGGNQYADKKQLRILVLDIETSTIEAKVFQPWGQDIRNEQVTRDWSVLCWAAKWYGEEHIYQKSTRKQKNVFDDSKILQEMWNLMDEADIIVAHNGKRFDFPKLNARFTEVLEIVHPSPYLVSDTCIMAKRAYGFTYNSLEALSQRLCKVHIKENHKEFPGMSLWLECEKKNDAAWEVMERYNRKDILVLEELFGVLRKNDPSINYSVFSGVPMEECSCGSTDFEYVKHNGKMKYKYTKVGRYELVRCVECGMTKTGRKNLHTKEKMESMRK